MKYYKILRDDMTHHGFTYHEGLNTDILPFNPEPICESGGLYFADAEHILRFCEYGNLIAEVEIPEGERVIEVNDWLSKKYKAHSIVLKNIRPLWDVETMKQLISEGADIHADNEFLLSAATEHGHFDIVKCFVEQGADIHVLNEEPLMCAIEKGRFDVVGLLVEQGADIHIKNEFPLRHAVSFGHFDIVKLLVEQGADFHVNNELPLRHAALFGYLDIVKLLVEQGADIHIWNDFCFKHGTPKVVEYLKSLKS